VFEIVHKDPKSRARLGRITTPHGVIETPSYVIVGTDAAVRCLEPEDIPTTKTQAIIANTYHLWQSLGEEGLTDFPGLHAEMRWNGPILTDSGGFQVFSMGASREHGVGKRSREAHDDNNNDDDTKNESPISNTRKEKGIVRVTDSGVYFDNNGEESYLDAELSMRIQEQLDADIIFAFDEPSSPLHDKAYTRIAMERTHQWALRCLEAKTSKQHLYGIVQGGSFEDLRRESAEFIGALPFEGIGIGGSFGSSFGSTTENTMKELGWTIPFLPEHKPRHLLGMGKIEDLFYGVEAGIDTFDCVIPTREARHRSLWTSRGRFDIGKAIYAEDSRPVAPDCSCPICGDLRVERKELNAMFKMKNYEAGRMATIHNVYFFNDLMEQMRGAIREGRFAEFKGEYLKRLTETPN
jgi:queuine tRNA-ribosyltransferase/7-cyano-7-deazaguanine tRNA-ribosyltransferase